MIPWLVPLFKSLEFPGGWKIEFHDLQKVQTKIEKEGLIADETEVKKRPKFSFESVADDNPNLALAGLRIEIEKRLKSIAESYDIETQRKGINWLIRVLSKHQILSLEETSVLSDMVGLLNGAVHGAEVDRSATRWAIEVGPRIIIGLDEKLKTYLSK